MFESDAFYALIGVTVDKGDSKMSVPFLVFNYKKERPNHPVTYHQSQAVYFNELSKEQLALAEIMFSSEITLMESLEKNETLRNKLVVLEDAHIEKDW
jgi:hypothetical protein